MLVSSFGCHLQKNSRVFDVFQNAFANRRDTEDRDRPFLAAVPSPPLAAVNLPLPHVPVLGITIRQGYDADEMAIVTLAAFEVAMVTTDIGKFPVQTPLIGDQPADGAVIKSKRHLLCLMEVPLGYDSFERSVVLSRITMIERNFSQTRRSPATKYSSAPSRGFPSGGQTDWL